MVENRGFTVNVTEFAEWGIAYAALAKGDVQILASQTDYVAQDYWQRNKDRLEKISPVSHGLYQGIAVPSYVELDSIEQLNDNSDTFNGKIVGIEPGSGLMRDTSNAVDAYGLKLQLIEGSHQASASECGVMACCSGLERPPGSFPQADLSHSPSPGYGADPNWR